MSRETMVMTQSRIQVFADKMLRRIGILTVVLLIICAGIGVVKHRTAKEVDLTKTIRDAMEAIGEFATYEYTYSGVANLEDYRQLGDFNIPFTKHTMDIPYSGVIKVGYQVADMDIQVIGKEIRIALPKPEILDNYLEIDYEEVESNNNILNPIEPIELGDWSEKEKEERLAAAEEMGLYGSAETNAKEIIRDVLGYIDGYHVSFK